MRRIFKFDNIQGNSLTHNEELNILVYEFSFGSSHVGVNYTRNSSGDKIANVNFFTTTSYTRTTKYNRLVYKFCYRSFSAMQVYDFATTLYTH